MVNIYVSFSVQNPNIYTRGFRTGNNQIAYFVYNAIARKFPNNTIYNEWHTELQINPDDILVTGIPCTQIRKRPDRTILVDNDNFEVGRWKHGLFLQHGINAEIGCTWVLNPVIEGVYGAIYKTNDVAIRKWNSDHPDVIDKKQNLLANIKNVHISPHPIDKAYFSGFYNPNLQLNKLKMLVYHAGPQKNAAQLIDMLTKNFDSSLFTITGGINKMDVNGIRQILSEYAYLAHTSYSEGFPYFANEFLTQGLPLYGHEEWWEPYGHDILKWTYDPDRQDQNLSNLKILLSNDFKEEYYRMRREVIQTHLDRTDNNWNTFTDKIIVMIEDLLANSG
jgi:hypothetical protein